MSGQQVGSLKQKPKRRRPPWGRITLLVIGLLLIIACVLFNILNPLEGAIVFTILPLIFTLLQWIFPVSPTASSHPETPQPIQFSDTVQPPPNFPTSTVPNGEQQNERKTVWNVPYRRNPFFTGRKDVMELLHEYFLQAKTAPLTQPVAITGLGGIGKTQVAVEYAYRSKDFYQYIFWVDATSHETIVEGFVTIARLLALPAKDEHDQTITIAVVQQWLATHSTWLLIMDNADDSSLISGFLPTGDSGHILLTTREQAWGSIARNFTVQKMSESEENGELKWRSDLYLLLTYPTFAQISGKMPDGLRARNYG